jgi:hypothetical protein
MFRDAQKLMKRVSKLPPGEGSPSNRYWCLTCRMLFKMDKPVCPYMPKVCINTPIPVETVGPESVSPLEKMGLFYPKIPQRIMAYMAEIGDADRHTHIGSDWVDAYLTFLNEWRFSYKKEPLQTLKAFVVLVTGCETAQRIQKEEITLILTDIKKVWKKDIIRKILESSLPLLRRELSMSQSFQLDDLEIIGEMETGKYYCPMCSKFFEFGVQKDTITCPLMPQKCMATPKNINSVNHPLESLAYVYSYTPDIFRRFIERLPQTKQGRPYLEQMLQRDWKFQIVREPLDQISTSLGL